MIIRISSLNLRYIKANGEDNQEISTIEIILIREITKIDIGQIVEIEEHRTEIEVNVDKITEEDHITLIIIEMTLESTILEKQKLAEVKMLKEDTEGIIEMIILEEVGVRLGTDNTQTITEGMK